jgi:anaphase-promoting complex subunit 8
MSPIVTTNLSSNHHENSFLFFSPTASSSVASPLPLTPGGGGAATTTTMELQVDWDPSVIRKELLHATTILSHRCLKLAAKWTAEQLIGLPPPEEEEEDDDPTVHQHHHHHQPYVTRVVGGLEDLAVLTPKDWYAKTLLDVGEYLHAAYILSTDEHTTNSNDVLTMPPPNKDLTSFGIYLRAYALYMAGERRKEEEHLELQR